MRPVRLLAFLAALFWVVPAFSQTGKTIIVLDASGSMWGQISGVTKIEIAREALREVLASVPQESQLGLIAYGHREKGSCSDIELAVPPAPGTAAAITQFADRLNPKGKTPLTDAVRMGAETLKYQEDAATVILVTDGLETCEADPCALAAELEAAGIDFTAHVVGFGLSDDEGRQVACLAESTGGRYFKADDAGQLAEALQSTVAATPEPEPEPEPVALEFNVKATAKLSDDGLALENSNEVRWDFHPILADGPSASSEAGGYGGVFEASLPEGRYLVRTRIGRITKEQEVDLSADTMQEIVAVLDAGRVTVTPKRSAEDVEADKNARVDVAFEGGQDGGYGKTSVYAAAGPITITGKIGKATAEESMELAAGADIAVEMVIGSGVVVPAAVYAQGGPEVEGSSVRFDVEAAKADINGNRKKITGQYGPGGGMDVPPGDYLLVARLGQAQASQPVSVKAGERTETVINLNAGVLAVSAPGAYRIDFLEATKNIQGRQEKITGNYGEEAQDTFHPGEYEVLVTYQGDRAEERRKVTVTAGERTEIAIE